MSHAPIFTPTPVTPELTSTDPISTSPGGWPVETEPLGAGLLPPEADLDQELVCRRVLPVTHDTVTVVLQPTRLGGVAFSPGQYLTLGVDIDGRRVERCYTISSPPTRPHLLTITVKRVPGGEVSGWIHDRLRPGDRVHASGPRGAFSVVEHPATRYLLLSAGSGITPTLSTLRTVADLGDPVDVVVVHCARTPQDLLARSELEAMSLVHPGLRLHWVCEGDGDGVPWPGLTGRISPQLLATAVPDLAQREIFTCGPPPYMSAVREALAGLGADPARCHEESFVLGSAGAPTVAREVPVAEPAEVAADLAAADAVVDPTDVAVAPADAVPGAASVTFARSGREVTCGPGQTVLEAAQEAGIPIPTSCGEGMCGTCKSSLLSGRVEMDHQGGIRPREIAQGSFLPCCAVPDGDVVVDA